MSSVDPRNPGEQSPSVDNDVRDSSENTDHNNQQQDEPAVDRSEQES